MSDSNHNRVLHFDQEFTIKEIVDYLSNNDNVFYYTRLLKEGNELHVVKYNDKAYFKINSLISQLFKFYDGNNKTKSLIEGARIKGNDKFIIIENMNVKLSDRLKVDLNRLLRK